MRSFVAQHEIHVVHFQVVADTLYLKVVSHYSVDRDLNLT